METSLTTRVDGSPTFDVLLDIAKYGEMTFCGEKPHLHIKFIATPSRFEWEAQNVELFTAQRGYNPQEVLNVELIDIIGIQQFSRNQRPTSHNQLPLVHFVLMVQFRAHRHWGNFHLIGEFNPSSREWSDVIVSKI